MKETHMVDLEDPDAVRRATLEAFADTIIPGEKRSPDDRVVAGVAEGGGAVVAGAITLLEGLEGGLAPMLDGLTVSMNNHAAEYAAGRGLALDADLPPFVALAFPDRTALVQELTHPGHPERELWNGIAIFSYMAFDSAAHMHTTDAIAAGHVGLTWMGFARPDADGLWRFPDHSYGRSLAPLHPDTTPTGSLP
jgi:hypothetical protein